MNNEAMALALESLGTYIEIENIYIKEISGQKYLIVEYNSGWGQGILTQYWDITKNIWRDLYNVR